MISYIEGPYEDEALFSLLARLYARLIGPTRTQFARHLFGNPRMVIPFDFPCGIIALTARIGQQMGLSADEIILKHTMFPIAAFLMSPEQADRVKDAMKGDKAVAVNLLKWHKTRAQDGMRHLNFCAKCRDADRRVYGHTWWRRTHQVPGVFCCPVHTIPLEVSQFISGQFWKFDYPLADEAQSVRQTPLPDGIDITYARDVRWMLNQAPKYIDPERLRILYHEQLEKQGLLQGRGRQLRRTEFLQRFYAQRQEREWAERFLSFNPTDSSAWPAQTVKNKANHRSFRTHLHVMRFLRLPITEIHGRLAQVDIDQASANRPNEQWIKKELRDKWENPAWTTDAIKKHLRIGIVRLLHLAWDEGLSIPRLPNTRRAKRFHKRRERHRAIILLGRSQVQPSKWKTSTKWLYRNDRGWLKERKLKETPTPRGAIIDWQARERDYIEKLPELAARVRAERPFRRVTATAFVSLLPFGASMGNQLREKLPRLATAIRSLTESTEEFTLRRVQVIRQLNPDMPPHVVREKAAVNRSCRNPDILTAMGYFLVGKRWVSSNKQDHPLYGLAVATGPQKASR